jgi:hypothetical protein
MTDSKLAETSTKPREFTPEQQKLGFLAYPKEARWAAPLPYYLHYFLSLFSTP